jgi:hypothetical protein
MNLSIGPMSKSTHVREPMPLGRKKQDAENAENAVGVSGRGHSPSSGPLCTSQFEGSGSRLISLFLAASASSLLAMMSRAESSGPQRSPRRSERAPRGQRAVAGLDHLQEPCNRRLRRMRQCQARGRPYRRFCVWPRPWRHRRCACRRRRPYHIHNAACVEAGHRANAQIKGCSTIGSNKALA